MSQIFIPFNVPSLKNSRVSTPKGSFHSPTVRKYLQKLGVKKYSSKGYENYKTRPNLFEKAVKPMKDAFAPYSSSRKPPFLVGFWFIRDSKRKFDLINAMQILQDLLVAHGVIDDDNADILIPSPFMINCKWYSYDKERPWSDIGLLK